MSKAHAQLKGMEYNVLLSRSPNAHNSCCLYTLDFDSAEYKSYRGRREDKDYKLSGSGYTIKKKAFHYDLFFDKQCLFSLPNSIKNVNLKYNGLKIVKTKSMHYEVRNSQNKVLAEIKDAMTVYFMNKSKGRKVIIYDTSEINLIMMIATWIFTRKLPSERNTGNYTD